MTTKVTIDAHAGWDVSVQPVNPETMEHKGDAIIVLANTVVDTHVWDDRALIIREIKK